MKATCCCCLCLCCSMYSGNSFLKTGSRKLKSRDWHASRCLSALLVEMEPVVCAFSYMKDIRPVRIVPTLLRNKRVL